MQPAHLSFRETHFFTPLICDYWEGNPALHPFYGPKPQWTAFPELIDKQRNRLGAEHRKILSEALKRQYAGMEPSPSVAGNIAQLAEAETYTVVTGHQLNLFTGPLFFFYKILACINATEELSRRHPEQTFVPIYWMATEDHDFDEINYFYPGQEKVEWVHTAAGAVGRMNTMNLAALLPQLEEIWGQGKRAAYLKELFERAYLREENLACAHRILVNELFGHYGLVCLDGDDTALKSLAVPLFEKDLKEGISHENSRADSESLAVLSSKYKSQAFPREVNFFYLTEGRRSRFVKRDGHFELTEGNENWDLASLIDELRTHPERFSPNVIMRPAFQEYILPNLAYIGGGGELAYWMQLKSSFQKHELPFPMLLLRPSLLLIDRKMSGKLSRLGLTYKDMFLDKNELIKKRIREISEIDLDFTPLEQTLQAQFIYMYQLAERTDTSFLKSVRAQEVKQINGLRKLEKRLLRAQKRKLQDEVERVSHLKDRLFPGGSLQERRSNFSIYYQLMGAEFIPYLKERIPPIPDHFRIETLPV